MLPHTTQTGYEVFNPRKPAVSEPLQMSSHLEKQNESRFPIVDIGASAGGLEALTELLQHLPPDTGMGFVFVLHLAPERESALTRILSRTTSMPVYEAFDNLSVEANHIYVIPPNRVLTIVTRLLKLHPRTKPAAPLRTIDFFSRRSLGISRPMPLGSFFLVQPRTGRSGCAQSRKRAELPLLRINPPISTRCRDTR